jgi:hypothetical protein
MHTTSIIWQSIGLHVVVFSKYVHKGAPDAPDMRQALATNMSHNVALSLSTTFADEHVENTGRPAVEAAMSPGASAPHQA